jgi:CDP-diacylglycerol--serine O-phosphatidyltransferase
VSHSEKEYEPKIYLLPNLMTAGNLVCGFVAIVSIIKAISLGGVGELDASRVYYVQAIWLIMASCLFDVLDGRLARLGGHESPFGQEFDSIADIVSFGVAPALLVMSVILNEYSDRFSILVASVYLVCGGMRLARFNCIATFGRSGATGHFKGFPIPAAAALISSLTLFVLWMAAGERDLSRWGIVFLVLMLFLSYLMISSIPYPSFKKLGWKTHRTLPWMVGLIVLAMMTVMHVEWMPALLLVLYVMYGLIRPLLGKRLRRGIEVEMLSDVEEGEDDEDGDEVDAIENGGEERSGAELA